MAETNFSAWLKLREQAEQELNAAVPQGFDPFTTLQQKQGDSVYFGVHDLSKHYRQKGFLPAMNTAQAQMKLGSIVDADPVNQTITVSASRAPFHFGYRKLEGGKSKTNPKVDEAGNRLVQIPVTHLQDVSHLFGDGNGAKIWLVIDGNTKYQQNLMREIRRREVERAHSSQMYLGEPDPEPNLAQPESPVSLGDYEEETPKPKFELRNREVIQNASFDPSIRSYNKLWKTHFDTDQYDYYPE